MARVIKAFFCIQEKKSYKVGDVYTGKRKDLSHLLEDKKRKLKLEKK